MMIIHVRKTVDHWDIMRAIRKQNVVEIKGFLVKTDPFLNLVAMFTHPH